MILRRTSRPSYEKENVARPWHCNNHSFRPLPSGLRRNLAHSWLYIARRSLPAQRTLPGGTTAHHRFAATFPRNEVGRRKPDHSGKGQSGKTIILRPDSERREYHLVRALPSPRF